MKIKVEDNASGRLDCYLAKKFPQYSRSFMQKLIKSGNVRINNTIGTPSDKVSPGDFIELTIPEIPDKTVIKPVPLKLDIIYEDDYVLAVNKPSGLVVHPAVGHYEDTLLNGLVEYAQGRFPVFLVHRLDKDTSGVLLVAKNEISRQSLSRQFQNRTIKKVYLAVVKGKMPAKEGIIDATLNRSRKNRLKITVASGRNARTEFMVKQEVSGYSLLEVYPITGRTHQIRAHFSFIKKPVLGDIIYGGAPYRRLMLHAYKITFQHPKDGRTLTLTAPLPEEFKKFAIIDLDEEGQKSNSSIKN